MKVCSKCKESKQLQEFNRDRNRKDGYRSECKLCQKSALQAYYKQNKSKVRKRTDNWYSSNRQKVADYKKVYTQENRDRLTKYQSNYNKSRSLIDPQFKLICAIRNLVCTTIRNQGFSKRSKTYKILGCEFWFLQVHLEYTFYLNYGIEYTGQDVHIDHIIPISSAKTEEQALRLNHWSNLQYLLPKDNLTKSNK